MIINDSKKLYDIEVLNNGDTSTLIYKTKAKNFYGLGERYSTVNHVNKKYRNTVFEKFTHQGDAAYFPLPFYITDDNHGVYIDTYSEFDISFEEGIIKIEFFREDLVKEINFYYGSPKEIIAQYLQCFPKVKMPPKWCFGIWASANRWDRQEIVEKEIEIIRKEEYPVSVIVLEAWSDETTFYKWNDSMLKSEYGDEITLDKFEFSGKWKNPKQLIDNLHDNNIKIVLWQIPALKEFDEGQFDDVHEKDLVYSVENDLVCKNINGTPYKIPKQWFIGSYIPDFDKKETRDWWFSKRQYLLDMGIDGFKTDGGEFIHDIDVVFKEGDGNIMRNKYPMSYLNAYNDFVGDKGILFSRAGYIGGSSVPIHWAGDQMSTFEEMRNVLNAGLSASLSGIIFWSFDIGGFAGEMPSAELYIRGTQMACFTPVMQWHSEPIGGQFALLSRSFDQVNDRSPWNVSKYNNDARALLISKEYAYLRMNLLPYIYSESIKAINNKTTVMKHMIIDFHDDNSLCNVNDQYMFGDLLVAPIVYEGATERSVYLPKGKWINIFNGEEYIGGASFLFSCFIDEALVFLKEGSAIALNLSNLYKYFDNVGNNLDSYENLCIVHYGKEYEYKFIDDFGNDFIVHNGEIIGRQNTSITIIDIKDLVTSKEIL